jgi:uncharacterized membrane protein YfcA
MRETRGLRRVAEVEEAVQVSEAAAWTRYLPAFTGLAALTAAVALVVFARYEAHPVWYPLTLAMIAFCCEFVDSSLGMGYGTTFTPLLLLMGFELTTVVPVILLSEFCTGMAAGGFHHALGNASFKWRSRDSRVAGVLAGAGVLGALVAVQFLIHVPRFWARLYFALMITGMGVLILARRNRRYGFSWTKIAGLGLISSFNKGMSGGGYGPLVVGGQVLSGCNAKNAVACTSIAESLVCFVGLVGFAVAGIFPTPALAIPIVAGALLSAPCASAMTRYLDARMDLKRVVGVFVLVLGIVCLVKVVG